MDNHLHNWIEAYKAIADLIVAKVPAIKHVDLYYGQENMVDEDGNWMPFRAPAVFLDFSAAEVKDLSEGKQELLMDIGVYLYMETVQDSDRGSWGQRRALEFMGLLRQLHQALHNAEGTHFGPLSRTGLGRVPAPPYVVLYRQTYQCHLLDYGASPNYNEAEPPMAMELRTPADPPVPETPEQRLFPFVGV